MQLLRRGQHVDRVIGDPLKIADGFQQLCGLLAVLLAHLLGAELDQVGAQNVLIVIAVLLILPDASGKLR